MGKLILCISSAGPLHRPVRDAFVNNTGGRMIFDVDVETWRTLKLRDFPYIFYKLTPVEEKQPICELFGLLGNGHIIKLTYQADTPEKTIAFKEENFKYANVRPIIGSKDEGGVDIKIKPKIDIPEIELVSHGGTTNLEAKQ